MSQGGLVQRIVRALQWWFGGAGRAARQRSAERATRRGRRATPRDRHSGARASRGRDPRDPEVLPVPGRWRVFGESIPGVSHRRVGKPGQDAHCWTIDGSGRLVAAVADGAGSAPLGGEGAECAARVAVEAVVAMLEAGGRNPRDILRRSVGAARAALAEDATERRVPVNDLATTLIVVIATRQMVAVAQIGDGFAVALDDDEELAGYSVPQGGEFANETVFLTGRNAVANAEITLWKGPISGIAMSSDGLERLALQFPQKEPYRPFFDGIFRYCAEHPEAAHQQLSRLLNSTRVAQRTADDLTLLVAWNRAVAEPAHLRHG